MRQIIDVIQSLGALNWYAVALAALVLESVIPGVHFMWFGLAAVLVGTLSLLIDVPLPWQLAMFGALSVAMILIVRRVWRPSAVQSDLPNLNVRGAQYIGRKVKVEEPITDGRGKVRIGDTVWAAEGPDTPRGAHVVVTGVNGTVLIVAGLQGA
jgi:membrane protein implicated in regulation of membrane protease activity